jgi:hypothetical protein
MAYISIIVVYPFFSILASLASILTIVLAPILAYLALILAIILFSRAISAPYREAY